jgi:hypothetical protein
MAAASAPSDPQALLAAWRRTTRRAGAPPPLPSTRRREAAAVQQATLGESRRLPTVQHLVRWRACTPSPAVMRAGPTSDRSVSPETKPEVRRLRRDTKNLIALKRQRRLHDERAAAVAETRFQRQQALIASSPNRLRRALSRNSAAVTAAESRRRGFDLTASSSPGGELSFAAFTPRHEKARYIANLDDAERAGRISPRWLRASHSRHEQPLPPIDTSNDMAHISDELQQRSAAKAARRGLPPVDGFTELSEAISAVVISSKAARSASPPRPLCGETMTYWDRVNFFNRFQESCVGANAKDLRTTIPKLRPPR